ncbi:MAG: FKBP-type peptidyl-prolyl cis-trans isomerase [Acidobacteriota bacterium]
MSRRKIWSPASTISLAVISLAVISLACSAGADPQSASAAENEFRPPQDAEVSSTGLVSQVLAAGTGEKHPDANDIVQAHYIGRDPQGKVFLSTYDRGQPGTFPLDKVFAGWSEGMQQMVSGEKRRLWIPARLAPANPQSGPKGDVIFDVELLGFLAVPDPPSSFSEPPEDARRLPSGAVVQVAKPGTGEEYPAPDDVVLVHYLMWDGEGKNLDSTYARNRPVGIPIDKVFPAFSEAVADMVVGEQRFVWMSQQVHGGEWPKAPDGPIALRVELVRTMPGSTVLASPEMLEKARQGSDG